MGIHGHLQDKGKRGLFKVLCLLGAPPLILKINRYKNLLGDASLHPPQTLFQKTCPSIIRLADGTLGIESCK